MTNIKRARGLLRGAILVLIAIMVVTVFGCSKSASTTTAATTTPAKTTTAAAVPTTTSAAPAKVYTLRWADMGSGTRVTALVEKWMGEQFTARSNGALKVEYFWDQTLAKAAENTSAIGGGAATIGLTIGDYSPDRLPLTTIGGLQFLGSDYVKVSKAFQSLWTQPAFEKEAKDNNVVFLATYTFGPTLIITKKPVRTLADLKGLQLGASSGEGAAVAAAGAIPVTMGPPDWAAAIERGTLDGAVSTPVAIISYKLGEVAKYATDPFFGLKSLVISVNRDWWNALPADLQQLMRKVAADAIQINSDMTQADTAVSMKAFAASGGTALSFSAADAAAFAQIGGKPLWDKWAADKDAKGLPGTQLLQLFLQNAK